MKTINYSSQALHLYVVLIPSIQKIRFLFLTVILLLVLNATAQDKEYTKPSWYIGLAAGANLNFYNGTTQELNTSFMVPTAFKAGKGVGLYLAPLVEFHKPNTRWGVIMQAGYDNRKGKFDRVTSPCNCPADLSTNLTYVSFEPSLRFAPFKSDFYMYAGPRVGLIFDQSFVFHQGVNPDVPDQIANPDVTGDFSKINPLIVSMQIVMGYDLPVSLQTKKTQFFISPFISYHPYFGQDPRSIESWNINTLRIGAAIKFGPGKKVEKENDTLVKPVPLVAAPSKVQFVVNSPKNIPAARKVRETFPLRNYVFFNIGSTEIPNRYVLLKKDQVKSFKEDQVAINSPNNTSGRSKRQMVVYYNVLNILGDRMGKHPESTITLVGSSEQGPEDAKLMSESIKTYLVDVFGISPTRIAIEGRSKPKIPSKQAGATHDLDLLKEGDRRVSIESTSPALLMEFQSGPNAPLKPVEVVALVEAPIESYLTFNANGGGNEYSSWMLEVKDDKGVVQKFGPYTGDNVSIPGQKILGTKASGDYTVTMVGTTKKGKEERKETMVHMVLWTPPNDQEVMRFSVIYEFNESKAISMYDKYLTEIVMPKIPLNGTVMIHGHTDIIGDATHNKQLSIDRANDVKGILEKGLKKAGRSDVKFEVLGFGEDTQASPFDNNYAEERFYNRTVIIDIIPQ
ncbi:MAG: flagellar motor protein MotB [Bacteroidetes bacterium B1(2017)]|nr:MAG: flagellar motor protein MotB [Bacteroidetes bacterium B1(2017)]